MCGSKYRYLVGSRQMVPEAALQVMLIRRPPSIWPIWNPDPDPGQTDAAHSSTDKDLPRSVQSCNLCLDDMPPFPPGSS